MGGQSSRMGREKQHIVVGEQSMGDAAIALGQRCCDTVVVSGPDTATCGAQPYIPDLPEHAGMGPLAGIEAVLASELAGRWLILPCDMPWLQAGALLKLLESAFPVACLGDPRIPDHRLQLPLAVDAALLGSVRASLDSGRRSVAAWLDAAGARIVQQAEALQVQNVNTPDDLPEHLE